MKTFKCLMLTITFITINIYSMSQTGQTDSKGTITGLLIDKEDEQPIGFSNVVLYSEIDSTMITWTISDDKGAFHLIKVPDGSYYITVNFIGYEKLKLNKVTIGKDNRVIDLGKVKLNKDAFALSDVNVVSYKNIYEVKSDKKVINVSNDINSAGGTAVDVLRNVPGLTVDADGVVNFRGSDNLSILVDGRPTSIDAKRLNQLSSSDIESIELITNPSVKYNPEGKSGIINLKLKHNTGAGLSGNLVFNAGTGNKYTGSAGINYNIGKFDFFAGYDGMSKVVNSSRFLLRESFLTDMPQFLQQNATAKLNLRSDKFKAGANIYLNSKNSLTVSLSVNPSGKTDSDRTLSQYFDKEMNLSNQILTLNSEESNETTHDYILGYRKAFEKKGEELTVDYIFSNSGGKQTQPINYYYSDSIVNNEINTNSKSYNSNFQINWIYPMSGDTKIESGIQSIVRATENNFQQNNYSKNGWIEDLSKRNIFIYNEQIHSAYTLLTSKIKQLSLSAGLRIEQTYIDGIQKVNNGTIKQNYFNIYPSFSLLDKLTENSKLMFSFSRRINRPGARMINPFADQSNPEVIRSGNPLLKPEYVNSFESGFTRTWRNSVLGFTVYYKHITDVINQVTFLDTTGVSYMFPKNMLSSDNYGVETTFEHSFAKWCRINGNASFYRNIIKGGTEENTNSNYSYNVRVNSNFTPVKKLSVQLTGNYTGPIIGLYTRMNAQYSIDAAIKKDFLKDKLSLTLRATDIFNTLKNSYKSWGANFAADNWRKQETRVIYLSLSYSFGTGKSYKSQKSEIRESAPVLEIY